MPRAKRIRPDLLHALTASIIAVSGHLIWALMPLPSPPPPPEVRGVHFTALTGSRPQIASPILFSLPSSLGFSSVALQQRNRILPPLNSPLTLSLPTHIPLEDTFPAAPSRAVPGHASAPLDHQIPFPAPEHPAANRWHLRALDPEPGGPVLHMFRPPQLPPASAARRFTGTLQFNDFGQVDSLLVNPGPVPPTADILQSLRHVRIPRESAPRRVPFELHFQPSGSAQ